MFDDFKASGPPSVADQLGERGVGQHTAFEVLNPAAPLTDQVVMVTRELLGQLVPSAPACRIGGPNRVGRTHQTHRDQQVHRPIHGHEVGPTTVQPRVDLGDRQGLATAGENVQHRAPRCGQAVPLASQEVWQGGGGAGHAVRHMQLSYTPPPVACQAPPARPQTTGPASTGIPASLEVG